MPPNDAQNEAAAAGGAMEASVGIPWNILEPVVGPMGGEEIRQDLTICLKLRDL